MSLPNVLEVTKALYCKLDQLNIQAIQDKTVVLSIGATGCGKSTMFASLVHGPRALEKKKIKLEVSGNQLSKQ